MVRRVIISDVVSLPVCAFVVSWKSSRVEVFFDGRAFKLGMCSYASGCGFPTCVAIGLLVVCVPRWLFVEDDEVEDFVFGGDFDRLFFSFLSFFSLFSPLTFLSTLEDAIRDRGGQEATEEEADGGGDSVN